MIEISPKNISGWTPIMMTGGTPIMIKNKCCKCTHRHTLLCRSLKPRLQTMLRCAWFHVWWLDSYSQNTQTEALVKISMIPYTIGPLTGKPLSSETVRSRERMTTHAIIVFWARTLLQIDAKEHKSGKSVGLQQSNALRVLPISKVSRQQQDSVVQRENYNIFYDGLLSSYDVQVSVRGFQCRGHPLDSSKTAIRQKQRDETAAGRHGRCKTAIRQQQSDDAAAWQCAAETEIRPTTSL